MPPIPQLWNLQGRSRRNAEHQLALMRRERREAALARAALVAAGLPPEQPSTGSVDGASR